MEFWMRISQPGHPNIAIIICKYSAWWTAQSEIKQFNSLQPACCRSIITINNNYEVVVLGKGNQRDGHWRLVLAKRDFVKYASTITLSFAWSRLNYVNFHTLGEFRKRFIHRMKFAKAFARANIAWRRDEAVAIGWNYMRLSTYLVNCGGVRWVFGDNMRLLSDI